MKRFVVALLTTGCASTAVNAADSGAYLTADFGLAQYSNVEPFPDPGRSGLGAGYRFTRYFGGELGFAIFSKSTVEVPGASAEIKARSFFVAGVVHVPVTALLSGFGKLGVTRNHASGSNTLGAALSVTRTSPYYALGAEFALNREWSLRAQYENFGQFENVDGGLKASAVTLGAVYYLQ